MRYKILFLLMLSSGIGFYCLFRQSFESSLIKNDVPTSTLSTEKVERKVEEKVSVNESSAISAQNHEETANKINSENPQAIVKGWMKSRGYTSKADEDVYQGYDGKVLKELSESGDLIATDVLADQFFKKKDIETGKSYLKLAAALGSTSALYRLTAFSAPTGSKSEDDGSKHAAVIETMSIAKVLEMRGDPGLASHVLRDLNSSYKRSSGRELQITAEDNDLISAKAKELYDSLVEERRKRGLVDFNNEYPAEVREFYGLSK